MLVPISIPGAVVLTAGSTSVWVLLVCIHIHPTRARMLPASHLSRTFSSKGALPIPNRGPMALLHCRQTVMVRLRGGLLSSPPTPRVYLVHPTRLHQHQPRDMLGPSPPMISRKTKWPPAAVSLALIAQTCLRVKTVLPRPSTVASTLLIQDCRKDKNG